MNFYIPFVKPRFSTRVGVALLWKIWFAIIVLLFKNEMRTLSGKLEKFVKIKGLLNLSFVTQGFGLYFNF